jgi:hypothetical protein
VQKISFPVGRLAADSLPPRRRTIRSIPTALTGRGISSNVRRTKEIAVKLVGKISWASSVLAILTLVTFLLLGLMSYFEMAQLAYLRSLGDRYVAGMGRPLVLVGALVFVSCFPVVMYYENRGDHEVVSWARAISGVGAASAIVGFILWTIGW